ncbi:MAG TPA: hypothetical protein VIK54_09520 [Acidimicrobiia bacterium]
MAADEWHDVWAATMGHLEVARLAMPDPDEAKLGLYREFLDANEQGLAFECLAYGAEAQDARREVWESLLLAAESMELDEDAYPHGDAVRVVLRHLADRRRAHNWRSALPTDLSCLTR